MQKTTKILIDRINAALTAKGLAVMVWDSSFNLQKTGLALGVSGNGILKVGYSRSSAAGWQLDLNQVLAFGFSQVTCGAVLLDAIIK